MSHLTQTVLATEPPVWLVAVLGISVVFVGLVAIVGIVWLMNKICDCFIGKNTKKAPVTVPEAPLAQPEATIPNRQEILAAVCAAVAEENGTDISAIRVISFKKL